jgi:hypothetical protein
MAYRSWCTKLTRRTALLRTAYRRPVRWELREMSLEPAPDDSIVVSGMCGLELMQEQLIRYGKFIGWSLQSTAAKTAGGLTYRVGSRRLALRINYRS